MEHQEFLRAGIFKLCPLLESPIELVWDGFSHSIEKTIPGISNVQPGLRTTEKMENKKRTQVVVKSTGFGAARLGSRAGHLLSGSPLAGHCPSLSLGSRLCTTEIRYLPHAVVRIK